ncbi:hypothetical protein N8I77_007825 [Diaporthe amygdali]|uniref:Uncharacterized protein n=1 Tax=Phomopsis amygdali TaxID=1214568 RepID=A0AAD9SDU4_PHOAM|nr:hypothetical protein N8I77_007825 [Diaporthe amygdali]
MEATKALAQRLSLRRRSSRWRDKRWSASRLMTGDTPARASSPAPGAGDPQATKATATATATATAPASAAAPAPTTTTPKSGPVNVTTAESENLTAVSPPQTDAAIPSPGSGISPTTIVTQPLSQSPQTEHSEDLGKHPDERVTDTVTEIEYFPHVATPDAPNESNPAEDVQTNKITFAIPTKEARGDGGSQDADRQSDEVETVTSSASPSTAVSPRESQDDYDEDAGRSSTLSGISGNGSRQSSINSVAFQLPNMSLPQGRTRQHKNSPPPLSR